MNKTAILSLPVLICASFLLLSARNKEPHPSSSPDVPVLVELFTSEGCSSCPPADELLQKFDTQPFPGAQLIVLSEHVDYWNHIGWTDPYSAHAFSQRQDDYGNHFHLESVYTPQIIVDGTKEFVGNSSGEAQKVFAKVAAARKLPVRISDVVLEGDRLRAHIDTGALPADVRKADVVLVVALNHAASHVTNGENAGRRLTHVAVVRSLSKVGSVDSGQAFSQDVSVKLDQNADPANLRLIAFVQEPGPARVLGVSLAKVGN